MLAVATPMPWPEEDEDLTEEVREDLVEFFDEGLSQSFLPWPTRPFKRITKSREYDRDDVSACGVSA